MANWNQRFLLMAALVATGTGSVWAQESDRQEPVIFPEVERREIKPAAIDTEDFEMGPFAGIISIQDFDSDVVYGARAAWHVTEDFFFEANYGVSQGDLTSYEKLSGGAPLFDDDDRDYTYYNLSLGWNVMPGEIFLFDKHAFKSDLYLIGGAGSTEFLDDNWFTVTLGVGYRLLLNDSFAWRIDVRDHIYDRDAFGEDETTNNIEWTTGLTFFF
ncbi:MAG: outer membrane beta-barrel domain-containing protein [Halieaceae bacterium]